MVLMLFDDDGSIIDKWDESELQPDRFISGDAAMELGQDINHCARERHSMADCQCMGLNIVAKDGGNSIGFQLTKGQEYVHGKVRDV